MKKLIDIRTGQAMFYSERTIKAGRLSKYLLPATQVKKPEKQLHVLEVPEPPKVEIVPEVVKQLTIPQEPEVVEPTTPTPEEMKEVLKAKGIKFSPNIGIDKLTERYEAAK